MDRAFYPIICMACGNRGAVSPDGLAKAASGTHALRCKCGSTDIDLDTTPEAMQVARPAEAARTAAVIPTGTVVQCKTDVFGSEPFQGVIAGGNYFGDLPDPTSYIVRRSVGDELKGLGGSTTVNPDDITVVTTAARKVADDGRRGVSFRVQVTGPLADTRNAIDSAVRDAVRFGWSSSTPAGPFGDVVEVTVDPDEADQVASLLAGFGTVSKVTTAARKMASVDYEVAWVADGKWQPLPVTSRDMETGGGDVLDAAVRAFAATNATGMQSLFLLRNNFNGSVTVYQTDSAGRGVDNLGSYESFYGHPYTGALRATASWEETPQTHADGSVVQTWYLTGSNGTAEVHPFFSGTSINHYVWSVRTTGGGFEGEAPTVDQAKEEAERALSERLDGLVARRKQADGPTIYKPFCSLECNREYARTVVSGDTENNTEPYCLNCGKPTEVWEGREFKARRRTAAVEVTIHPRRPTERVVTIVRQVGPGLYETDTGEQVHYDNIQMRDMGALLNAFPEAWHNDSYPIDPAPGQGELHLSKVTRDDIAREILRTNPGLHPRLVERVASKTLARLQEKG